MKLYRQSARFVFLMLFLTLLIAACELESDSTSSVAEEEDECPALVSVPENGVIPTLTQNDIPPLPFPDAETIQNVIEMWAQVKKPSTVVMVIDTSGSMDGTPMTAAIAGAQNFIDQMHPNDEILVLEFNDNARQLRNVGLVGEVGEELRGQIGGLDAGGGTSLYATTIEAVNIANQLREEDRSAGTERIYGIVLMTDGENSTDDGVTEGQMFNALPDGLEADQVHIHTIGYGNGADSNLLSRIAAQTNGSFYQGSIEDIEDIYFDISSEF